MNDIQHDQIRITIWLYIMAWLFIPYPQIVYYLECYMPSVWLTFLLKPGGVWVYNE